MTAQALDQQTYLPHEGGELAKVYSFLDAHEQRSGGTMQPRYLLVGANEHDQVELPADVHAALKQVVTALQAGRAVTIAPRTTLLTTQQAADVLGVSRPTVRRLIDAGDLPAEKVGNRHRLLLSDVLAYQQQRRTRQYEMLADTGVEISDENDPAEVARQLKSARKAIAERRRARSADR
ncbi:helix-turn-helix domain-containing protein (plasmid) [Rhodococcus pseudokoreensis]|jgi:excisionase family DNA binding protein|uniref:Helix-turn-helix domain-containing protein n=1 Tax=Rhodococcus pseudokoreensis TaxID=2811421 RepID=A0A974VY49_9NOCA|nr:helix-turn-helix domain-containing protein [Rhodococcus pseudokoreensis]QSE87347.1 helix-turn-helix domain-containing protein [Rhodococcus pseudokoreensis]RYE40082.1 MAG: DNA-binding protein [Hyphomicrobiales bacterium]